MQGEDEEPRERHGPARPRSEQAQASREQTEQTHSVCDGGCESSGLCPRESGAAEPPASSRAHPHPERRAIIRVVLANCVAVAVAALLFALVWHAEGATALFQGFWRFCSRHPTVPFAAAISPLIGTFLIGFGYMRRARARRLREQIEIQTQQTP